MKNFLKIAREREREIERKKEDKKRVAPECAAAKLQKVCTQADWHDDVIREKISIFFSLLLHCSAHTNVLSSSSSVCD